MPNQEFARQLRRYAAQDSETIVTWPQSPTEAHWWAGPQTPWPVPTLVFQRWHSDPDVHPYMLSNGATMRGYGELWVDAAAQEVELARLIVAPAYRGQRFGIRLVALLREAAQRTAYDQVFLRVVPQNHTAIACYLRAGLTAVSTENQQLFNQDQPLAYLWMQSKLDS